MSLYRDVSSKIVKMAEKNVRWAFNVTKWNPTPDEMQHCTSCIQLEEKERLGRFVFKSDLKSSLIGRLLMRKFVSKSINTPYNEVIFSRNDHGKPILEHPNLQEIKFNVSHQGDFVIFAGSHQDNPLGVDVMKLEYKRGKKLSEFFRLMCKQFSNFEWEIIKNGTEEDQVRMFYRNWSLKESYVKALGVGITVDLQNISFKIHTKNLTLDSIVNDSQLYINGKLQNWEFHEMLLDKDHCAAVAMSDSDNEMIMFRELTINDLIENSIPILERDVQYCDSYFNKLVKS